MDCWLLDAQTDEIRLLMPIVAANGVEPDDEVEFEVVEAEFDARSEFRHSVEVFEDGEPIGRGKW